MEFRLVSEDEWRSVDQADVDVGKLKRRVAALLGSLAKSFDGESDGIVITASTAPDSRIVGELASPVGKGRFVLEWDVLDNEIVARVVLQRAAFDQLDRVIWEPVWAFFASDAAGIFFDKASGTPADVNSTIPEKRSRGLFEIGFTAAFALAKGPLTA